MQTARRSLASYRDGLAAQIQLLKLELKDAESAFASAAADLERFKPLTSLGVVAKSAASKAQRNFEVAELRVGRARTLLELYRKVDSPDEKRDRPAADFPGRWGPDGQKVPDNTR